MAEAAYDIFNPENAKIGIIILAGGKGARMESGDIPKVLISLYGRPLITHLLHSIEAVKADTNPIIIVGYKADMVKNALGNSFRYAVQSEQLGTGHAVLQARELAAGKYDHIVVLYGDHPHVPAEVINELIATHLREHATLTMMTVQVSDFEKWRVGLYNFGRVVRDSRGNIQRIVEKKDASVDELEIKEVNPAYFCFRADWLWENISQLQNNNTQKEFYLTDLLEHAIQGGEKVATFSGDPLAALGVNTKEELRRLEEVMDGRVE